MTHPATHFCEQLRAARERAGVSLREIADITKLSLHNLTALENNRIAQLPGGIYRRAIVRAYASHVGLDPEQTLRAFLAHYPDDVPTWEDLLPAPGARHGSVQRIIGALGTLIPLVAGLFHVTNSATRP